jgi:hypothetical protein
VSSTCRLPDENWGGYRKGILMPTLTGKILIGHDYIPDWIDVEFLVDSANETRVAGEFYSGQKRIFTTENFRKHFTHKSSRCIACEILREIAEGI